MSTILQNYDSNTSSEDEENNPPAPKRAKRANSDYVRKQEFATREESRMAIIQEKSWKQRSVKASTDNKRIYYDCKWSRQCPVKMILQIPNDCEAVLMFQSVAEHNHELKTVGLNEDTKESVNALFRVGVRKPNAILKALREKGMEPKKSQLENYLKHLRSKQGKKHNECA